MARRCQICGRGSVKMGVRKLLRGHMNPTGTRHRHVNLQWFKLASGERVKACTRCMRTTTKKAAVVAS